MTHPLAQIEPRLRLVLPATLYAQMWVSPNPPNLQRVFDHLRSLHRSLQDYVPSLPAPGWQEGTLLFSDLAGFTSLSEANAARGDAIALAEVLNTYFATMLDITTNFGGELLEFAGDSLLVQFRPRSQRHADDGLRAVYAGLQMQIAMADFRHITVGDAAYPLCMRIGIDRGRYLSSILGSPRRQQAVILGSLGHTAKRAEGLGQIGRVCVTPAIAAVLPPDLSLNPHTDGHFLLAETTPGLPDYAPTLISRQASPMLWDRSLEGMVEAITSALSLVEPLASYLPRPVLELLVENTRQIPPDFPIATVLFINICNIELVDTGGKKPCAQTATNLEYLSLLFILINAIVEGSGGIIQKVTCHTTGSSVLAYFGVLQGYTNDAERAVNAAIAIRALAQDRSSGSLRFGLERGAVFAAEVGEMRGRREFNILGDTVNTAARLMDYAVADQILITETVAAQIAQATQSLGEHTLKGKAAPLSLYAL